MKALDVAISPCPNDTFAFAALLERALPTGDLRLEFTLADIETLNRRVAAGQGDVSKASFAALLDLDPAPWVLPVGAALGRGVGPVVLAGPHWREGARPERILAPGPGTTAALLFAVLHPDLPDLEHCLFSEIGPALARGEADWGVCIHEARFTYQAAGLALVEDLGLAFERDACAPLPLGGLVARRDLPRSSLLAFVELARASIDWARAHPGRALEVMRRHAAEQADRVLWQHVELYVTGETRALGPEGRRALASFAAWAARAGRARAGAHFEVLAERAP